MGALPKEAEEFGGLLTFGAGGGGGAYSTGQIIFLQVSPCQGRRQRCVGGELTGYTGERKRKEREAEPRYLETEMGTERGRERGRGREETGHTRGDGKRRRGRERHGDAETVERDRNTQRWRERKAEKSGT